MSNSPAPAPFSDDEHENMEKKSKLSESPVITKEPTPTSNFISRPGSTMTVLSIKDDEDADDRNLRGLASLAIGNTFQIEIDKKCCHCLSCNGTKNYNILDLESDNKIFTGVEKSGLCSCFFSSLQNVLILDQQKVPVARVCYKEKSFFSDKIVIAVYAPPDLIIGSAEEFTKCYSSNVHFKVRNTDGKEIIRIDWKKRICGLCTCCCNCGSYFKVISLEKNVEIARITPESSSSRLKLIFKTKLSITVKVIVVGFCIGLIQKSLGKDDRALSGSED